jgi:hypothetical protein
MRYARTKHDEAVSDLTRRVFDLPENASRKKVAKAEEALLEANPSLRESSGFRAGATVSVPEVSGVATTEKETWSPADDRTGLVEALRRALDRADEALSQAVESCRDEAKVMSRVAKRRKVQAQARSDKGMAAHLNRVVAASEGRVKQAEARRASRREGLKRLRDQLDQFLG